MKIILYISAIITIVKTIPWAVKYIEKTPALEIVRKFVDKTIDQVLMVSVSVQCIGYCLLAVIYGIMAYEKYDLNVALLVALIMIIPSFYFFYKTILLTKPINNTTQKTKR